MRIERPFLHEDADRFRSCIAFTAKEREFTPALIEKDYFCSLILSALSEINGDLVFKGGTCLGKVFLDFFRLSEDLDFAVSVSGAATRSHRRKAIAPYKNRVAALAQLLPGIEIKGLLTGRNESTQYIAAIEYDSLTATAKGNVKIEIGLREELVMTPSDCSVRTLLLDPITGDAVLPSFPFMCINQQEAWAEKARAALCRLEPAIRDYFDLDFAGQAGYVDMGASGFVALVKRKLDVPGNGPVQITDARRAKLEDQKETDLKPVLRSRDFERFDLDRIWAALVALTNRLKEK